MRIPYTKYKIGTELERLPLISVRLACNNKKVKLWALIDSGADFSVFNADIAAILGVDLEKERQVELAGFVGGSALAWIYQVNLEVEGLQSININVAFTESSMPELCLVGQRGFFDKFQIRFERYKDLIEIYPKSTAV
jgi:predicted aspartyl protease